MKNILFLFFIAITTLSSCGQEIKKGAKQEVKQAVKEDVKSVILDVANYKEVVVGKDIQLVDVRTSKEYQAGHIDDAINIDYMNQETFNEAFEKLDKNKPLYIYCRSGNRSQKSVPLLKTLGFKEIYDLKGGYNVWSNQ